MRIVFIGPPGAGKGTQAQRVTAHLESPHLSTGDMLREAQQRGTRVGRLADQYMSAGQLVPDAVIVELVSERLARSDCRGGYLLDGFPRTLAQALALDEMLQRQGTPLDVALELQVPEDELFQRLSGRGRADDTPEVIRQRLEGYRKQTQPLIDYYAAKGLLVSVAGVGTTDEVFARIQQALDRVNP